jgi:(p)ppGpp synthase/HD superfamily hydrolase
MIAEITRSLAEEGINVVHISFGKRPDSDRVDNTVQILAENLDRLQAVLRKLRKLPGVHGARRKAV